MIKTVAILGAITVIAHIAKTIYNGKIEEERYFRFISSGRFLTEEYS